MTVVFYVFSTEMYTKALNTDLYILQRRILEGNVRALKLYQESLWVKSKGTGMCCHR